MKNAISPVIAILKARGYRITAARQKIVTALAQSRVPVSIRVLAQKVNADEASVYRTVDMLRSEALIEAIHTRGEAVRFALSLEHHDHLICRTCGKIAHIPCSRPAYPDAKKYDFAEIDDHEVTLYGLCRSCD